MHSTCVISALFSAWHLSLLDSTDTVDISSTSISESVTSDEILLTGATSSVGAQDCWVVSTSTLTLVASLRRLL